MPPIVAGQGSRSRRTSSPGAAYTSQKRLRKMRTTEQVEMLKKNVKRKKDAFEKALRNLEKINQDLTLSIDDEEDRHRKKAVYVPTSSANCYARLTDQLARLRQTWEAAIKAYKFCANPDCLNGAWGDFCRRCSGKMRARRYRANHGADSRQPVVY
jgi:hypothetical protein